MRRARQPFVDVDMGIRRYLSYDDPSRWMKRVADWPLKMTRPPLPAVCHPERLHSARGMCASCHGTWRRWMRYEVPNPPARLRELGLCLNGRDETERLTPCA